MKYTMSLKKLKKNKIRTFEVLGFSKLKTQVFKIHFYSPG